MPPLITPRYSYLLPDFSSKKQFVEKVDNVCMCLIDMCCIAQAAQRAWTTAGHPCTRDARLTIAQNAEDAQCQ